MRHLVVLCVFAWYSLFVALRRLVRGAKRPTWSWFFESIVEVARWVMRRQARVRRIGPLRKDFPGLLWSPAYRRVSLRPAEGSPVPGVWIGPRGGRSGRVLFYLHGGGYVSCSTRTHRDILSRMAIAADARVFAVDYRLAPEHPYPAALHDSLAAWRWFAASEADPSRIAIGGDSAGGGLALATMLSLRDAGERLPAAAVLFSPWVQLVGGQASVLENAAFDYLGGLPDDALPYLVTLYAGAHSPSDPLLSPLLADLHGLPPMLVQAGGAEILRDQIADFAGRAREAGVEVEHEVLADMVHVCQGFAPVSRAGRRAIARAGEFLIRRTGAGSGERSAA